MSHNWSTEPFAALYDAISNNDSQLKQKLVSELQTDLISLLIVKEKSEASRKKLETGELTFSNGSIYKVNKAFIENSIKLSDSLNIDELIAAEILYFASYNQVDTLGTSYLDSAIAAYYTRRDYILQIVCYYLCSSIAAISDIGVDLDGANNLVAVLSNDKKSLTDEIYKVKNYSINTILKSFQCIEKELILIKESIDRSKILGSYHETSPETKTINFRRGMLFKQYQSLGEILHGYISASPKLETDFPVDDFIKILDHISEFSPEDIFSIVYIPSLFAFVSKIDELPDTSVDLLHKKFIACIDDIEKLSDTPMKALIFLVFFTHFIDWCKQKPGRTSKYEFTASVDEPMQKCISVGALEQLLSVTAETALVTQSTLHNIKPFYDFRTFLQQHIPRFLALRLYDTDENATLKLKNELQQKKLSGAEVLDSEFITIYSIPYDFTLTDHFVEFLVPVISNFIHSFISTAAFMMTQLRDQEEDLLLSSDEFNLELLTESADLERLYMSMYYLYSGRENYCSEFWVDTNSASYGFLQWASRCNSPLIMSAFSMVLAALASGEENAVNVFSFLQLTNSSNTNLLTNPRVNSTLLTKYSSISWSTIYSTLSYYNEALAKASDLAIQNISNNSLTSGLKSKSPIVTELGEDSIIYVSGFFQVLSQVALNSQKARVELLESDNYQLFTILTNLLNMNTSLSGSIMTLLGSLVGDNYTERCKCWQVLDNWIFRNGRKNAFVNLTKERFSKALFNYELISGFIDLITKLLQPLGTSNDIFEPFSHTFPLDLGSMVRRPGIWCYVEYLFTEVLPEIDYSTISEKEKHLLKFSVLRVMELCLEQLDPDFVLNASATHVKDMDALTRNKSIISYLQSHPGSAVLSFVYKHEVFDALFKICNLGIDRLGELPETSSNVHLLEKSIKIIDMTLARENFYSGELINILRLPNNPFTDPTSIGMGGLKSFYESFLLNLPLVANLSLYVGSDKLTIAKTSLSIIRSISGSKIFSGLTSGIDLNLMKKNRLLATYETIDESIRIRSSFIEQLESPIVSADSVGIKVSLLQFLNSNISIANKNPTVTHFLLGFDTNIMNFGSSEVETTIASNRSLLNSIIKITKDIVSAFSNTRNLDYAPVRICALSLEILLKLCKSDITSDQVLNYLRTNGEAASPTEANTNYFLFLLQNTHVINKNVFFSGLEFDGEISSTNRFCFAGESMCTLNAFVSFKSSLLQLLATEIHSSAFSGSLSLTKKYLEVLTHSSGFASGSSKLMNYLDILDFKAQNMIEKIDPMFSGFDYEFALKKIKLLENPVDELQSPYDLTVIDKMVSLFAKDSSKLLVGTTKQDSKTLFELESIKLKKILTCSLSYDNFKLLVFKYLTAWSLLVQIIVTEIDMKLSKRSNFILEVFQNIIPKIDEYLEVDPTFAEDLISLSVHLIYTYNNDREKLFTSEELQTKSELDFERLFPIFKVSLHGIFLPTSTAALRSDLYILATAYLKQSLESRKVAIELTVFIKSLDAKVFDIICHDSLVGEGSNRITSLVLLESFVKVIFQLESPKVREDLIFSTFCKDNYIHLLVQKLKLTDECFSRALDRNYNSNKTSGITLQELLYELTSFKATVSFLIRIAQTKIGAQQLLRNEIFSIIKECRFLQLDADLGFELNLKTSIIENGNNVENFTSMVISLDYPLGIASSMKRNSSQFEYSNPKEKISYYEIFIPIFQLITTLIITLGPQNDYCLTQGASIQKYFSKLITAVLKRELIYENHLQHETEDEQNRVEFENGAFSKHNVKGLQELTKLFTLLDTLVN